MSKNAAIEIFLRVRPTKKKSDKFQIVAEDHKVVFTGLKELRRGEYVNNTRDEYNYCYNGVFGMEATQIEVFNTVAKDVIESAFDGYNGTIFAYGQTGSGKTFTMTGEPKPFSNAGLIPRSVLYIFSETARRTDTDFNITISYMQIYNDKCYDLLTEQSSSVDLQLTDMPRVMPFERANGELILSGLSSHRVTNEDDAFKLMLIGDTHRVVCETPMNDSSTRSHCIFTFNIESCKHGSDTKTVSKLHLVDLSGSERPSKSGVDGKLLKEACYINQSLFFLEQVINSLHQKMNSANPDDFFIPYRNSIMTMVLRDSLGGNCKTRMISTIHVEEAFVDESIATCNFAMRVASIKNQVVRNEAIDPNIIIQKLKQENLALKAEISMLRGGQVKEELTAEDVVRCQRLVKEYVASKDPSQKIALSDPLMINQCFLELKGMLASNPGPVAPQSNLAKMAAGNTAPVSVSSSKEDQEKIRRLEEEVTKLKIILKQRDNEIAIFLNMLNKGASSRDLSTAMATDTSSSAASKMSQREIRDMEMGANLANLAQPKEMKFPSTSNEGIVYMVTQADGTSRDFKSSTGPERVPESLEGKTRSRPVASGTSQKEQPNEMESINQLLVSPLHVTVEKLKDREACLEMFRKSFRKREAAITEFKEQMRELGTQGKSQAAQLEKDHKELQDLKNKLQDLRRVQALQGMKEGGDWKRTPEEIAILSQIDKMKVKVQEGVSILQQTKSEVTTLQNIHQDNLRKLEKSIAPEFAKWFQLMMKQHPNIANEMVLNNSTHSANNTSVTTAKLSIRNNKAKEDVEAFFKQKEELNKLTAGIK